MTDVKRLPALVSLQHLSFQFANGETLLDDLNLSIDHTPTGIVGRNGRGKSILAKLIVGRLSPSSGSVHLTASVAYVPQRVGVTPEDTVAHLTGTALILAALERMANGTAEVDDLELIDARWDLAERLRTALDNAALAHLKADSPADQLSGGQLARVMIIGALLSSPQLLVLDEPTNHLDSAGRQWLLRVLEHWRGGLVVVSHDRQLLNTLGRIIELSPQGARVFGGNYDAYRAQREIEQRAAIAALDHARLERSREQRRLQKDHDTLQRKPLVRVTTPKRPTSTALPGRAGKPQLPRSTALCAALTANTSASSTHGCVRLTSAYRTTPRPCWRSPNQQYPTADSC